MGVRHEQHRLHELRAQAAALLDPSAAFEWPAMAFIDGESGALDTVGKAVDALLDGFSECGPTALRPIGLLAHMAAPIARLGDPIRAQRLRESSSRSAARVLTSPISPDRLTITWGCSR